MQNLIVGISGIKGFGKSTYLEQLVRDEQSLVVIDTLGEHREWCPMCPEDALRKQVEALAEPPESFQWSIMLDPDESEHHLNSLCKAIYRAGDMTVVLEEADYFSSPNRDCTGVELLTNYGRHRKINIVWAARNPSEVSRRLTSQTDIYVMFRTTEPLYVEKLAKRLTPELALEIRSLPQFEYIICQPGQSLEVTRGRTMGQERQESEVTSETEEE